MREETERLALRHWQIFKCLCPQLKKQLKFNTLQAQVDAMKQLQAETAAELDALLPAILDRAFKGEL
ncbi:hypothetical protein FACS1894158_11750 [Betaproteobacteria bacterium]|nr:hypothetical protein FACS1894158_11750 [Betaproteobacteria bacterium]